MKVVMMTLTMPPMGTQGEGREVYVFTKHIATITSRWEKDAQGRYHSPPGAAITMSDGRKFDVVEDMDEIYKKLTS